ncbi:hypothetical protein THAOC_27909 [Thalassiosira oceanica]|uniref:Uncharacterized protein n=1 Tax=Thalassiosira oceanica TaxID=159749 RepID=K0RKG5_THAOC|nr:hypothetical protein THAOC_27909 [Thalassiosira oceanica]|eukprot:EJK52784.1 hypothetical protein THAOC_27909 [Thalassiosira oceanica]
MAGARGFTRLWYQMRDEETKLIHFTLDAKRALPLIGETEGDGWAIVDPDTDIPALPTNPWGHIEITRLDLCQVELVSIDDWEEFLWTVDYGDDDVFGAPAAH